MWERLHKAVILIAAMAVLSLPLASDSKGISFQFQQTPISEVLTFLAHTMGVNLILDPKVDREISISLQNVTPEEAINIIVQTNGLALQKVNKNTIFISSPQAISQISPPTFFTLHYAQAKDIYDKLKAMLPNATIQYDETTNNIIAFTDPQATQTIRTLLSTLDQPNVATAEPLVTNVLVLHYMTPDKVNDIIQNMFGKEGSPVGLVAQSPASSSAQSQPAPTPTPTPTQTPQVVAPEGLSITPVYPTSSPSPSASQAQVPSVAAKGGGALTISVDKDLNALVIKTTQNEFAKIKELVAMLDVPVPQVMIQVRVLDVNETATKNLGINWQQTLSGIGLDLRTYTTPPTSGTTTSTTTASTTGNQIPGYNLNATVDLLIQQGNARVLDDTQITTLDRQKATIFIGQQVPIITQATVVAGSTGTATSNASFANVGVNLTITPAVNDNDYVTLQLNPVVSTLLGTVQSGGTVVPQIGTRNANTQLRVKSGTTIFLGGLIDNEERSTVTKVPLLGDIPILGKLFFTHTNKTKMNDQVVFLITPNILY